MSVGRRDVYNEIHGLGARGLGPEAEPEPQLRAGARAGAGAPATSTTRSGSCVGTEGRGAREPEPRRCTATTSLSELLIGSASPPP